MLVFVTVDLLTKASHAVAESKTHRQQLKGFLSVQQTKRQDMSVKIKEALRNEIINSRKHQVMHLLMAKCSTWMHIYYILPFINFIIAE